MNVLQRMLEHPDAPHWNHRAGDRLGPYSSDWLLED